MRILLREARKSRGLTQGELARLSGVDENTLARIEQGRTTNPGLLTLEKLAKAMDMKTLELVEV